MGDAELVRLLRNMDEYEPLGHDGWKAADRIEALKAERDALKAAQIDAIRAAMEETVAICTDLAVGYEGHECAPTALIDAVSHIRAPIPKEGEA